jgi:hypothetical protein
MEQWKKIIGYEKYEISTLGNVRSNNGKTSIIRKQQIHWTGYPIVQLCKTENGKEKRKTMRVHRLIAEAFIPNPYNLKEVDHIDKNRANNDISNLRWCNHSQNNQNKNKQSNNKSGTIGVSWDKRYKKWTARIKTNKQVLRLFYQ